MTIEEIRSAIMATLSSTWATRTVISYPNQPFTAPQDAAWISPHIKMGESFVGEIGARGSKALGLRTGVLMIQIFVPAGSGAKTGLGHATVLENLFRRADIDGVRFDEPATDILGIDEGNGAYCFMMSCSFNTWVNE